MATVGEGANMMCFHMFAQIYQSLYHIPQFRILDPAPCTLNFGADAPTRPPPPCLSRKPCSSPPPPAAPQNATPLLQEPLRAQLCRTW